MKTIYEVSLTSQYFNDLIYNWCGKYNETFKYKKDAIAYARSIKNELKEIFKDEKENTITIDITKYNVYEDESGPVEEIVEIVYSLNIVGRY